jgi:cell division protease FtsH
MPTEQEKKKQMPGWAWAAIVLVLMAALFWMFWGRVTTGSAVPYSGFIEQVKAGNVSRVQISGSRISGIFIEPVSAEELGITAAQVPATNLEPGVPPNAVATAQSTLPMEYRNFTTAFPEAVGDSTLMTLLESRGVHVDVTPASSPMLPILLMSAVPMLLFVGLIFWMRNRSPEGSSNSYMGFASSKARRHEGSRAEVTFEDVAGAEEAKSELKDVVDFLRNADKYRAVGARIPRGVLLVGPPGTGKTLMARAVAGEASATFFNLNATEFVEMFVGVGASRVRDLFNQARAASPSIIFIDEMDAVGRRRGTGVGNVNDEREQTLNQLLVEMDGFDERAEVVVMAATNRPDVLDPALQRPGRFDRQVTVSMPDRPSREAILHVHSRPLRLDPEVDLELLARTTMGFSGADLANLCNEAAILAARRDGSQVTMHDFEEAMDKVMMGSVRPLLLSERDRRTVAYHEAGHALVAWLTPAADPVHKVTITPRGQALGVTAQMPGEDRYNYTRTYLKARLSVLLGGRAAEEIAFCEVTTGAENDLKQATRLARHMITRWGMGNLGLVAFEAGSEQPFLGYDLSQGREYSESMAAQIDQELSNVLQEHYEDALAMLTDNRDKLDALAEALLREETIDRWALLRLLGPREVDAGALHRGPVVEPVLDPLPEPVAQPAAAVPVALGRYRPGGSGRS